MCKGCYQHGYHGARPLSLISQSAIYGKLLWILANNISPGGFASPPALIWCLYCGKRGLQFFQFCSIMEFYTLGATITGMQQ